MSSAAEIPVEAVEAPLPRLCPHRQGGELRDGICGPHPLCTLPGVRAVQFAGGAAPTIVIDDDTPEWIVDEVRARPGLSQCTFVFETGPRLAPPHDLLQAPAVCRRLEFVAVDLSAEPPAAARRTVARSPERPAESGARNMAAPPRDEAGSTKDRTKAAATGGPSLQLGWAPVIALIASAGLLLVAHAYSVARAGAAWAPIAFWAGVLALVLPVAFRLCSRSASETERVALLVLLGMGLYLVKLLHDPAMFTAYDELQHWRTADDILKSGHLFTQNSLLPVSPLYPGLEIITSAISNLCGLTLFWSGVVVVGSARLLLVLALYLFARRITKSPWLAALATLVYLTNSGLVFFDAQFAYESLALPLAVFILYAAHGRLAGSQREAALTTGSFLTATSALVITHHLSTYMLLGYLCVWTGVVLVRRLFGRREPLPLAMALWVVVLAVAWLLLIASLTVNYLTSDTLSGVFEILRVIMRSESGRAPFQSYSGEYAAPIERLASLAAMAITLGTIALSLPLLFRRHRGTALVLTLGLATLGYPASLAFHLTRKGDDIAGRAPEFVFIAVGIVAALGLRQLFLSLPPSLFWRLAVSAGAAVLLTGGMVTGWGPSSRIMPGGWVVAGDSRSVDREGIAAANWARTALGPDNRFATDRVGRVLLGTFGSQHVVTLIADRVDESDVYFSPYLGPHESSLLTIGRVRYMEVDLRLSEGLPVFGVYFEATEPNGLAHTVPIPRTSLQKFASIPGVSKLFDAGDIAIYDVRALDGQ